MKRDLDIIRDILLYIEENSSPAVQIKLWNEMNDKYTEDIVLGHLYILNDSKFIDVNIYEKLSGNVTFIVNRLTAAGHDYLDSVRDPQIWKNTKNGLSKIGGSASIAVVQATAVALLKSSLANSGINI